jgi:anti-sigma regulatory factor (Ser/Thr protein kinase)
MTPENMSFELAGGPYAVTAARLALADLDSHLDPSAAFDVRLLVSELVTNSVQHGGVGAEDSVRLDVSFTDDAIRVLVSDSGPGFEPPESPPPDNADTGWGLFLVEQLAKDWGMAESGSGVWFELPRSDTADGDDAGSAAA